VIQGYLSLILHAHLPFVRHPEHDEFLEEDWLYEAITETYIPLINMMDGMLDDGVDFRLTMSLTPPLCAMLRDDLLQQRYVRYVERLIELTKKEIDRTRYDHALNELAWFYHDRLQNCRHVFVEKYGRNLLSAFRRFQDAGKLEIITSGATHGFLPFMKDYPQAIRAQIMVAKDDYRECFGRDPKGIWLPECAYDTGMEKYLQEAEIRWFVLDSHGLMFGEPRPQYGVYAPAFTRSGPAIFARDQESSRQVWSSEEGYPGDANYRDFYRDIGFDLEYEYIRPYIQANGQRKFTGIKYSKITGATANKEPYRPLVARDVAAGHAGNFLFNRERQIEYLHNTLGISPIVVSPYDAELFGHWWYEGPEFLNFLLRKIAFDQSIFKTITPSEYLQQFPRQQVVEPCPSTWGNKGYGEVWLEGSNSWIYPHLHLCAERMIQIARDKSDCYGLMDRAMKQLARELLLAQSSDWAFIMKTGTTVPYAVKRTKEHILRFNRLYEQISNNTIDERFLAGCEWRDNIFQNIHWRHYL